MEIKNLEEVFHLLKMKSNIENLLAYIKEHKDSTIVVSAKSKDLPNRYIYLDNEGIGDVVKLLNDMGKRFDTKLKEL